VDVDVDDVDQKWCDISLWKLTHVLFSCSCSFFFVFVFVLSSFLLRKGGRPYPEQEVLRSMPLSAAMLAPTQIKASPTRHGVLLASFVRTYIRLWALVVDVDVDDVDVDDRINRENS